MGDDYDIKTLPRMSIVRFSGRIEIPEKFDIFSAAQRFMPFITSQIKTTNSNEKELLEIFLGNAADIPVLVGDEEIAILGKLSTDCLYEGYDELEDYNEQDVFIPCKVIGLINKENVEIFNPLKTFIRLPRAVRREMDKDSIEGLESIYIEGPVLKVEVIAIYK